MTADTGVTPKTWMGWAIGLVYAQNPIPTLLLVAMVVLVILGRQAFAVGKDPAEAAVTS